MWNVPMLFHHRSTDNSAKDTMTLRSNLIVLIQCEYSTVIDNDISSKSSENKY